MPLGCLQGGCEEEKWAGGPCGVGNRVLGEVLMFYSFRSRVEGLKCDWAGGRAGNLGGQDHHRPLGMGLLSGRRVGRFLMSEVPLYAEEQGAGGRAENLGDRAAGRGERGCGKGHVEENKAGGRDIL